ncbi:hypothetical protein [Citrobacter koseri]|uniref:hypothetical protein n=1 Tax=Citrobacter koseri TaxID=545 RepID=UPI00388DCE1E
MIKNDLTGAEVFEKLQHLEKLNPSHAWICCAWINRLLKQGYDKKNMLMAVGRYVRESKEYITKRNNMGLVAHLVFDNTNSSYFVGASAVGSATAYGLAQPAAVVGTTKATAASVTSATLASNIVAPLVGLGVTLLLMTFVIGGMKAYGRRRETNRQQMMDIVDQMEILLKEILDIVEREHVQFISITQDHFDGISEQLKNITFIKAIFHAPEIPEIEGRQSLSFIKREESERHKLRRSSNYRTASQAFSLSIEPHINDLIMKPLVNNYLETC